MKWTCSWILLLALAAAQSGDRAADADRPFTVGTYNLEGYIDVVSPGRTLKTAAAKAKIRESLRRMNADILAVQEIGRPSALEELRTSLKADGLDYPHAEHVAGWDTNIFVGVLSRFPIVARRPHTNDHFLLEGRRFQVSRGFAEVDVRVAPNYTLTVITAHLKSRRTIADADQAAMRAQEAILLRQKIDAVLERNARANLVVLGDFNDTKDTPPIRTLIGRGRNALVDTRPAERNGDTEPNPIPRFEPRHITWTHYYGKEDSYSRVDYILVSPGLAREWDPAGTHIVTVANWGVASDHRPITARFHAADR